MDTPLAVDDLDLAIQMISECGIPEEEGLFSEPFVETLHP